MRESSVLAIRSLFSLSVSTLCVVGAAVAQGQGAPVQQGAPMASQVCAARFQGAFTQLQQRKDVPSMTRAYNEVSGIFGPSAGVCEAGAYQRFMDSYLDFARPAIRASAKGQNAAIFLAIATAGQSPARVPAEDGRAAVDAYRQTRAALYAIADDVKETPQIKQLLEALDRSGPPQIEPAQAPGVTPMPMLVPGPAVTGPGGTAAGGTGVGKVPAGGGSGLPTVVVQPVRVPQVPMPAWAILSIYEAREALKARDVGSAQGKLDAVMRWLETAP